jgi:curved DNA-binding protein CbpA
VWHPDRFVHDQGLQTRAQEKLAEINRAYERLESFFRDPAYRDAGRRAPDPPPQSQPQKPAHKSFQEQLGLRPRRASARGIAHDLDAALERYESKLRRTLGKIGLKLPKLTSEGRIKGLLVLLGAVYLLITTLYILSVL